MRNVSVAFVHAVALAFSGFAMADPVNGGAGPVRLDELAVLSGQVHGDDAVIATIEQRGVAFVLAPRDFETLRTAGVGEGVLRYLQGRAAAEQGLRARIVAGRPVPAYFGAVHLGYPYLGYHDGLHYYGGVSHAWGLGHGALHIGGHHGNHHGRHH